MALDILIEEELEREANLRPDEIPPPMKEETESSLVGEGRWRTPLMAGGLGVLFVVWFWMTVLEPRFQWMSFSGAGGAAVQEPGPEAKPGDQSSYFHADTNLVRSVQNRLNILGFKAGPVDGVVGPRTMEALERFQLSQRLTVTGVIDRQTKNALDGLELPRGKSKPYLVARARNERAEEGARFIVDLSMNPALSREEVEKYVRQVTRQYAQSNPESVRFHVRAYLGIASLAAGAYAIADWERKGEVSALDGFRIRFQEWARKDVKTTLDPPRP